MISIIVAAAKNGVIGKKGDLPWYLPAELARFKQITMGHPIIMGRKTHESIGRTLPGRLNIVITRNPSYKSAEGTVVKQSLSEALNYVKNEAEVFVIGGEALFEESLKIASKLYLTKINADLEGDRFFTYNPGQWEIIASKEHKRDQENPYAFEFLELKRKNR